LTDNLGGNTGKTTIIYVIEELARFLQENPIHSISRYFTIEENVERWMKGQLCDVACYKTYVNPKLLCDKKKWIMECTAEELKDIDINKNKIEVLELTKQFKNSDFRVEEFFDEPSLARRNCYILIAMTLLQSEE
jgi:hypothetical protein